MRVIAFNIWGDYGFFKKFYTTSSPLTYSIPPPTAVFGMIGALLGVENYNNMFNQNNLKVAIRLNNHIRKTRIATNWIEVINPETKRERAPQINQEFLKECSFTIYLTSNDELLDKIKYNLVNHRTEYTMCLGSAQCLANFQYIDEYNGVLLSSSSIWVSTVTTGDNTIFELDKNYIKERVPITMDDRRQVSMYNDVIIETDCKTIAMKGDYVELPLCNIAWLN